MQTLIQNYKITFGFSGQLHQESIYIQTKHPCMHRFMVNDELNIVMLHWIYFYSQDSMCISTFRHKLLKNIKHILLNLQS